MAYGEKYRSGFYDRQNSQWRVRIYLDGYGGEVQTDVVLGKPPVVYNYSGSDFKYDPIITSSIEVKILAETLYDYREFFVRDETDYVIALEKFNGSTWERRWIGYLMPDVTSEQYQSPPNEIILRASDGLSRLKGEYFVSSGNNRRANFYTGLDSLSNIIGKCLATLRIDLGSSNFTVNRIIEGLNTYEVQHTVSDSAGRESPLTQTRVDQAAFLEYTQDDKLAFSKWEVLENIMKIFGARLFLAWDDDEEILAWHIYTVNDYDGLSINRGVYEVYDGTSYYDEISVGSATLTETISTTVANEATEIIYANANHETNHLPAVQEIVTRWVPKNQADSRYNNLALNGEFEFHSNSNISDWNSSSSLKGWTGSAKAVYQRWKIPPTFYQPTQYVPNNYGVQFTADDMYLTSDDIPVFEGYSGTNIFWLGIRTYCILTDASPLTTGTTVNSLRFSGGNAEPPYAKLEVRLTNGSTTYYLKSDASSPTYGYKFATGVPANNETLFIQYERCAKDYILITASSGSTVVLSDIPAREGAIIDAQWRAPFPANIDDDYWVEIDIYACRRASTNAQERVIEYDNGVSTVTKTEDVNTVYEYVRVNVSNDTGVFGSGDIKYAAANTNVRTSYEPTVIETVIGDPVEGEGLNVGALRYNDGGTIGPPTGDWEWNGTISGSDGSPYTIHRLLAELVSRAYASPTIRLTGDFSTAYNVLPHKHFQLSDNSTTKDMMLMSMTWDVESDIATCDFVQVEDTAEAPSVIELFTEDIPQVGQASNGSITSYKAPAIDPDISSI